ncbi:MAG: hypothetical protein J6N15_07255 [Ruminiclostridium sp.]|nr:hypothetical protein [Ruminiclostridium sp.]
MDTIESIKTEIRHKKWREMYEAYLSSGQTVTEWCAENGISKKTFYYRLRQLRKDMIETVESHDIVPITAVTEQQKNTDASIKIHGSGISIELPVEISPEILSAAIRGLRTC